MLGTREYYDKTAAEWAENGYGDGEYLPCLDEFLSLLPPGGRVLDLCCGAGYETGRIRARGFEALGLDFSGGSLRIARERNPDLPFYQGDMLEDYAHIGMVDGILLSAGLVHVETADLPDVEVLVAGHHGSNTSNTRELLETVRPKLALISVGQNNKYGHPGWDALARLDEIGAKIYRTDLYGTIEVRMKQGDDYAAEK